MLPQKSPGPDGYNAFFFQKNWNVVSKKVTGAALSFKAGRLLSEVNHTFVTLVPKTTTVSCLSDNRPISCCNVIYKIISKVLANRLQQVIGELISANQSDFLQDWLICDAPFLLMS